MLVIAGAVLGVGLGAYRAKRLGGGALDIAQYAAGFGIACALLGAVATVLIHRMAV